MISTMNSMRFYFLGLLSFLVSLVNGQSYQKTDLGLSIVIDSIKTEISFYSPSAVRIVKSPVGRSFTKESLSVIKKPQKTAFSTKQQGDVLNLKSDKLVVSLNVKSAAISYATVSGQILLKEKQDSVKFIPFTDAGNNTFTILQGYTLDKDEAIYGLGQQQQGRMIQRNLRMNMIQNNTSDYVPFFNP